jgi:hypothetical protein
MVHDPRALLLVLLLLLALLALLPQHTIREEAERPLKRARTGPRRYGARLVWSYDELFDDEFYRNYRMSKDQFRALADRIRNRLPGGTELSRKRQKTAGGATISAEIQLSIALRFLAGGSYIDICRVHQVPFGSFRMITKRVIAAINTEMSGLILLPINSPADLVAISKGFLRKTRGVIYGCVGAIDGISVQITRPEAKCDSRVFPKRSGEI